MIASHVTADNRSSMTACFSVPQSLDTLDTVLCFISDCLSMLKLIKKHTEVSEVTFQISEVVVVVVVEVPPVCWSVEIC